MRRALASTLLRGLRSTEPCAASSSGAVGVPRAYATQTITATMFPGDGGCPLSRRQGAWRRPPQPCPPCTRPALGTQCAAAAAPAAPAGIGPEIADAVMRIFEEAEAPIAWDVQLIGKEVDPRTNSFITRENLDSVLVSRRERWRAGGREGSLSGFRQAWVQAGLGSGSGEPAGGAGSGERRAGRPAPRRRAAPLSAPLPSPPRLSPPANHHHHRHRTPTAHRSTASVSRAR